MGRILVAFVLAASAGPAAAISRLDVARVVAGGVEARDVRLTLAEARLELAAATIDAPAGTALRDVAWSCEVTTTDDATRCSGDAKARLGTRRARGRLAVESNRDHWRVALSSGRASMIASRPSDAAIALRLQRVPLAWFTPAVASAAPKLVPGGGTVDATLSVATIEPLHLAGTFGLSAISFDSADGAYAASDLTLEAELAYTTDKAPGAARLVLDGRIASGQWLAAPIYVDHAGAPAAFAVTLEKSADGYAVPAWSWRDEDVLAARGSAAFAPDGTLRRLVVERYDAALAQAWPRYAQPALAGGTYASLEATGSAKGRLAKLAGQPLSGEIELADVSLRDADGRYAVEGLAGTLVLEPSEPRTTTMAWRAAALHRIAIGAGHASIVASGSAHALAAPLVLETLGGRVRVPRLALDRTGEGRTIEAAAELESLSVRALTEALDWPPFEGTLSGRIPSVRVEGERIDFDGALELDVFDGRVTLGGLSLERAFGVAPSLAADVVLEDLALKPLTDAFSFGTIEGRLDGRIAGLRLVDWKPIEFALTLETDRRRGERQRISQRAVDSLSTVGGAGAGAGIQRGMMRMFDSFPYSEIGISCTLSRNVCTMGGLDSSDGGYTIVRGAGLPRLTVIGHQRRVDWPVLVARLEAATKGAGPVID